MQQKRQEVCDTASTAMVHEYFGGNQSVEWHLLHRNPNEHTSSLSDKLTSLQGGPPVREERPCSHR